MITHDYLKLHHTFPTINGVQG